jgi:LPS sulfotransferase NodH
MPQGAKIRFAILALQRTGTNMLGSILRNTGKVHMYGEVFYPDLGTGDLAQDVANGLFYPFWRDRIARDPRQLLLSDPTIYDAVFNDFLDRLFTQVDPAIVGIDIKSEQIEAFPRLFHLMRQGALRVVHLERRNYLARIVSQLVLNHRMQAGEADVHRSVAKVPPLTIDPDMMLDWIHDDAARNRMFRDNFAGMPDRYLHVFYEDIAADGAALRKVFDFLGMAEEPIPPPDTVKQVASNFAAQIANYEQVAAALAGAGHSGFLRPA